MAVYDPGEDRTTAAGRGADELGHVDPARRLRLCGYHARPGAGHHLSTAAAAAAAVDAFSRTAVVLGCDDGRPARPTVPAGTPALLDEVAERPGQADVDDEPYVRDIDPCTERRGSYDRTPLVYPLPYDLRLLLASPGPAVVDWAGELAGNPFGPASLLAVYNCFGLCLCLSLGLVFVFAPLAVESLEDESYGSPVLAGYRARDCEYGVRDVRPVRPPSYDRGLL